MYSIIIGTILLSIIHALIPNHWLPLVAIARTEKWTKSELFLISSVTATAHVLGTVILGTILGIIGTTLAHKYEDYIHIIAPVLMIVFGLVYFSINRSYHGDPVGENTKDYRKSKTKVIAIFVLMMFLSPCLEVQSLFLAVGAFGMDAILLLGLVYAIISVIGIMSFVMLAFKGSQLLNSGFMQHHEKRITGFVLIIVGIVTFFIH